jgi:hypothetical protein
MRPGQDSQPEGKSRCSRLLRDALAHLEAGRPRLAIQTADAAVALAPDAAHAYALRSTAWRALGDYVKASLDHGACLARDPHFVEASALATVSQNIRRAFLDDAVCNPAWLERLPAVSSPDLSSIISDRARRLAQRRRALERPSCPLPCPSQCCYLDEEPFVFVEPAKLAALAAFLRRHGLREQDHLARAPVSQCAARFGVDRLAMFAAHEEDGDYVYFVRRDDRRMPRLSPAERPRHPDVRPVGWLNRDSRACSFLSRQDGRGCLVHRVGRPPGLEMCRAFLCLTGFAFVLVNSLGRLSRIRLRDRTMADLHETAVALLPALEDHFAGDEVVRHESAMHHALSEALDADEAGKTEKVRRSLDAYRLAQNALATRQRRQRRIVRGILGGRHPAGAGAATGADRAAE